MLSEIVDPAVLALLTTRRQERDALLARAQTLLEQDERVVCAWLFGSLGRGSPDDLSDLDLFVVVAEEHADTLLADHTIHIAGLGTPLLILDAPQNRPPGGAYNMALYDGQNGPHQVDWYWQPRSLAAIPAQTRLLFDRAGLPHLDTPPHFEYQSTPERTLGEQLTHQIDFFRVMLLIAAKYIARSPDSQDTGLLDFVDKIYAELRRLALPDALHTDTALPVLSTFEDKLRHLRALALDVVAITRPAQQGGIPFAAAVVPSAARYLDFVELLCRAQQR